MNHMKIKANGYMQK